MRDAKPPDPRAAFAWAGYLSLFAVLAQDIWHIAAILAMALAAVVYWRVSLPKNLRRMKRLWQTALVIALLRSVFSPAGAIWLRAGPVILLSSGGLTQGLVVFGRLAILLLGGSLFSAYRARELIQGMIQLKLPYEIAYMVSVGLRFVPLLGEEMRDRLTALALRGVVIKELKLRRRLRVYLYLTAPAVAGSLLSARALALSMEMRGFRAYPRRTSYFTLTMDARDHALLAVSGTLALLTGAVIIVL
ncbi:MAG: energy-coupling factor transporter transmembrane protein EcfT [Oscillospiraceae bacterium]|nr:energy-coupling factor transporter transmembrane protein EcfT [Oscillospiraceae bacterium]